LRIETLWACARLEVSLFSFRVRIIVARLVVVRGPPVDDRAWILIV